MEEAKKPKKGSKEISARSRLNYIIVRLQELADERERLIAERKALNAQRRSERGKETEEA